MSTITKEQAKDLRNAFDCWQQDYDPVEDKEQYDMFGLGMVAMDALLASLEAEAVEWRVAFRLNGQSGSDFEKTFENQSKMNEVISLHERAGFSASITPLYAAPSAPVYVPDELTKSLASIAKEYQTTPQNALFIVVGWNACRAAMLQGADGNSPAHSGCRPAQNCISPAQCGNSPAIPDGWVMVPEEPTHEMLEAGDEQFGTYDVYRRMIAASPQQK